MTAARTASHRMVAGVCRCGVRAGYPAAAAPCGLATVREYPAVVRFREWRQGPGREAYNAKMKALMRTRRARARGAIAA